MASSSGRKLSVEGLCCAPITAFKDNGEVDLDIIPAMVQHFVDFGIQNAFVTGSNGEGISMSVAERKQVAEAWVKESKGKLSTVILHIGAGNLVDSQELARHAAQIGADAIACVGPTYFKPQTMDLYIQYMAAVAGAAPNTPFMLYDVDVRTGITFNTSEFLRLGKAAIPTLAGVKHTTPDFVSINHVQLNHPDMELMLGHDQLFLEGLSLGIKKNITSSVLANVHRRMIEAFEKGDMKTARLEQSRTIAFDEVLRKMNLNNVSGSKAILRTMGMEVGQPRLPNAPVSQETVNTLKERLTAIGFYDWGYAK